MNPPPALAPCLPTASGAVRVETPAPTGEQIQEPVVGYIYFAGVSPPPSPEDFIPELAENTLVFDPGVAVLQRAGAVQEPDSSPVGNGPFGV